MPEFQVYLSSPMSEAKRKTRSAARWLQGSKDQNRVMTAPSPEHLLGAGHPSERGKKTDEVLPSINSSSDASWWYDY